MTLIEILAKVKADAAYDPAADLNALIVSTVAEASTALNAKNTELLGKLKEAKKVADGLPEGFTVEEWERINKLVKDVDLAALKGDEKLDTLRKQMTEAHAAELKGFEAKEQRLTAALESQLIDNAATAAITSANGNSALLLPHVKGHIKMVQGEDGEFSAIVVDSKGTERFSMVNAGKTMQIDELVGEFKIKEDYKSAFSPDSAGGGAGGGGGGGGGSNPWLKGKGFSLTEQAKIANATPDIAKSMRESAQNQ